MAQPLKSVSSLCCRQKHEKGFTVCCLAWHPSGSQIAYTDTEGRLGLLDGLSTPNTDTSKVHSPHHPEDTGHTVSQGLYDSILDFQKKKVTKSEP